MKRSSQNRLIGELQRINTLPTWSDKRMKAILNWLGSAANLMTVFKLRVGVLAVISCAYTDSTKADNHLTHSYQFLGFNKALLYIEELDIDYDGLEFETGFLLKSRWFIDLSHYDLSREYILNTEQINKRSHAQLGYRYPIHWFNAIDLYSTIGWIDNSITSPFDEELQDEALSASVGIKQQWWKLIELYLEYHYVQWSEQGSGNYASLGASLQLLKNFAISGNIVNQQDAATFRLGIRFYF